MSGLPKGPYTVKNLKPIHFNLNKFEYEYISLKGKLVLENKGKEPVKLSSLI